MNIITPIQITPKPPTIKIHLRLRWGGGNDTTVIVPNSSGALKHISDMITFILQFHIMYNYDNV